MPVRGRGRSRSQLQDDFTMDEVEMAAMPAGAACLWLARRQRR